MDAFMNESINVALAGTVRVTRHDETSSTHPCVTPSKTSFQAQEKASFFMTNFI